MKYSLLGILAMLAAGIVLSCASTGAGAPKTTPEPAERPAPSPAPTPSPAPPNPAPSPASPGSISTFSPDPRAMEELPLEHIYDQHKGGLVLSGAREYTVIKGDTLSHIASEHYGAGNNAYYFPLIIAASKLTAEIIDPDVIEVGMKLIIPDLQKNLDDPDARSNLKTLLKEVADFYSGKPGRQSPGLQAGLIRLYNTL